MAIGNKHKKISSTYPLDRQTDTHIDVLITILRKRSRGKSKNKKVCAFLHNIYAYNIHFNVCSLGLSALLLLLLLLYYNIIVQLVHIIMTYFMAQLTVKLN